ncbi:MAG: hypothetical protein R3185_08555 [Candidatus Thermoplasmatota archaeon]|nr:hypothetical protein [Candidatus Thermoplasmatota archaeon]
MGAGTEQEGDSQAVHTPAGSGVSVPGLVGAGVLFVIAVLMLAAGLELAREQAEGVVTQLVRGHVSALGSGWLVSYLVLSATFVADLTVGLVHVGVVDPVEGLLMVTGSRLGAAGIVVLIGGVHYLQVREARLRASLELGVLTFLVSHAVFLPAGALGYLALLAADRFTGLPAPTSGARLPEAAAVLPESVAFRLGLLAVALILLYVSIRALDAQVSRLDLEALRGDRFQELERPWVAFTAGASLTAITTSVAFSVGLLVPLYNQAAITRRAMIPYLLGAGIGTFSDTLLVAVVLGSAPGLVVLGALMVAATIVTLLSLLLAPVSLDALAEVLERVTRTRTRLLFLLLALGVTPVLLVLI